MTEPIPTSLADLDRLVAQQVQESLHLDYKASLALNNRDEISKDVSAFLNSDGGTIVYGIQESNHMPVRIDGGIDHSSFSRERLEQVILSNIAPRPSGITVVAIPLSASNSAYTVGIERTMRGPHQDAKTKKYYKRFEFQSVPMEHFEIEDVRSRRALLDPLISVRVDIRQGALVELVVENTGSYPALDVTFDFDPPINFHGDKNPPFLARGTKYFPPSARHSFMYGSYLELMAPKGAKPTAFSVTATYRHSLADAEIREAFQFDLADFDNSSVLTSDIVRAGEEVKQEIQRLAQELQRVRSSIDVIGRIAGYTGLTLSMPTIQNLMAIADRSLDHPRADCREWTPHALMEALGISNEMARAIYGKTYRGDLSELESVPGITSEIVAGVKRLFE